MRTLTHQSSYSNLNRWLLLVVITFIASQCYTQNTAELLALRKQLPPAYGEIANEHHHILEKLEKKSNQIIESNIINKQELAYAYYFSSYAILCNLEFKSYNSVNQREKTISKLYNQAQEAAKLFLELNNLQYYQRSQYILGYTHFNHIKFEHSRPFFESIINEKPIAENLDIRIHALFCLAWLSWEHDVEYYDALQQFLSVIKLASPLPKTVAELTILEKANNNIGELYAQINQIDTADKYFQKAMDLSIEMNDSVDYLWTAFYYSIILINADRIDQAKQLLTTTNQYKNQDNASFVDFSQATAESILLYKQQNLEVAEEKTNLAIHQGQKLIESGELKYFDISFVTALLSTLHLNKAELSLNKQQHQTALNHSLKALYLAENKDDYSTVLKSLKLLDIIYEQQKKLPKDSIYIAYNSARLDLIQQKGKEHTISLLKFEHQLDSITITNQQLIIEQSNRKTQNTLISFFLIGIILISLFILLFIKYRIKRIKIEEESIKDQGKLILKEQQKTKLELQEKLIKHARQQETIEHLSSSISKIESSTKQSELKTLLKEIKENNQVDDAEQKFLSLNQEYTKKLAKQFPNLTHNNLLLCIFIKSGLNSKEIADIKQVTIPSIKVARSRLRKKLNITKSQSLFHFLNAIDASEQQNQQD